MPVYNAEMYLTECLKSLQKQTYSELEILLIDDSSTDGSWSLMNSFAKKDNRICCLKNQNGKGVSGARNTGLTHAKGKYVVFLDSDDTVNISAVETLVKISLASDCTFVFSNAGKKETAEVFEFPVDYKRFIEEVVLDGLIFNLHGKLFKTWVLQSEHVLFDEELDYGEDFLFVSRYMESCLKYELKGAIIPQHLYFYNTEVSNSLSKRLTASKISSFDKVKENLLRITNWNTRPHDRLFYYVVDNVLNDYFSLNLFIFKAEGVRSEKKGLFYRLKNSRAYQNVSSCAFNSSLPMLKKAICRLPCFELWNIVFFSQKVFAVLKSTRI